MGRSTLCPADIPGCPFNMARTVREMRPCCPQKVAVCNILEPFCMEEGQIEFFDLGKSPIYRESFAIGGAEVPQKGFEITDVCIGCGKCKKICPQQCILEGEPFAISQEHCLHCGSCYEKCPVQAVQKRGEGRWEEKNGNCCKRGQVFLRGCFWGRALLTTSSPREQSGNRMARSSWKKNKSKIK